MKTLKRRKKEGKTDYKIRLKLLKAGVPRIVLRKSNRYAVAQYVVSDEAKDRIVTGITSKILLKYGWPEEMAGSLKSVPASYLTGLLFGKRIKEKKLDDPVIDIGMIRSINKNRIFSFIKGLVDAGVKIKSNEENFPKEERIRGKNLKRDFSAIFAKIKSKIEETGAKKER